MDSFKLYGNGAKVFKTISTEETIALFKDGSKNSLDKIFEGNLNLVTYSIEKNFYNESDKEELFQVGSLGLWKAVSCFDVSTGNAFSTYAVPMIIGEIRRYIRDNKSVVRVSRSKMDLSQKIFMLQEQYAKYHSGQEITMEELAKLLYVSISEISDAIISRQDVSSFDQEVYDSDKGDGSITLGDQLSDPNSNIFEEYEAKAAMDLINKKLDGYSKRDKDIISRYYAFNGEKKQTQTKISDDLGISQAQVARITLSFRRSILKELGYDSTTTTLVKNTNNIRKFDKKNTLYEQLNNYDSNLIDQEFKKLEEEKQILLLNFYNEKFDFSSSDKQKVKSILNELIFNLAMKVVKNNKDTGIQNTNYKGNLKVNNGLNQKVNNINDVIKLIKSGKYDNEDLSTNPEKEEVIDEEINDSKKYNVVGSDNMEVKVESNENELTGFRFNLTTEIQNLMIDMLVEKQILEEGNLEAEITKSYQ